MQNDNDYYYIIGQAPKQEQSMQELFASSSQVMSALSMILVISSGLVVAAVIGKVMIGIYNNSKR